MILTLACRTVSAEEGAGLSNWWSSDSSRDCRMGCGTSSLQGQHANTANDLSGNITLYYVDVISDETLTYCRVWRHSAVQPSAFLWNSAPQRPASEEHFQYLAGPQRSGKKEQRKLKANWLFRDLHSLLHNYVVTYFWGGASLCQCGGGIE